MESSVSFQSVITTVPIHKAVVKDLDNVSVNRNGAESIVRLNSVKTDVLITVPVQIQSMLNGIPFPSVTVILGTRGMTVRRFTSNVLEIAKEEESAIMSVENVLAITAGLVALVIQFISNVLHLIVLVMELAIFPRVNVNAKNFTTHLQTVVCTLPLQLATNISKLR